MTQKMMNEAHFFSNIDDQDEIRQGDVICKKKAGTQNNFEYGLIANADCDLAQGRNRKTFTWLKVISLRQYYEEYWAPEKAEKIIDKQFEGVLNAVNAQINRIDGGLKKLNRDRLIEWIVDHGFDSIFSVINNPEHPVSDELKAQLKAFDLLLARKDKNIGLIQVIEASKLLRQKIENIKSDMERALSNTGGFPDYFLLPELPSSKEIGFVIHLRTMASISVKDIYKTELEARLDGAPNNFFRIGRLSDRVRYGVMQKLGFLFMRIGDHPTFESACKASYEIVIEDIVEVKK